MKRRHIGILSLGHLATDNPAIVLGQKYLPNRVGLSSEVTLGLAVTIGGGAAPFIGKLADIHGVWMALTFVCFLPILVFLLALTLPDPSTKNAKVLAQQEGS